MTEFSEIGSSNSIRVSPSGTITTRTCSASTVSSGEKLQPQLLIDAFGRRQRLYCDSDMVNAEHQTTPSANVGASVPLVRRTDAVLQQTLYLPSEFTISSTSE